MIDSTIESESDAEEEDDVSENEILGEQSDTVDVAGNTNSTVAASGGT